YRSVDLDTSLFYARQALALSQVIDYQLGIQEGYNKIGLVYSFRGNYPAALDTLLLALRVAETRSPLSAAIIHVNLGDVYHLTKSYQQAINSFQAALPIFANQSKINYFTTLIAIADVYCSTESFDSALTYTKLAFKALDAKVPPLQKGSLYYTHAKALIQPDSAISWLQKAIRIFREQKHPRKLSIALAHLAERYLDKKEPEIALPFVKEAIEIARTEQFNDVLATNQSVASKIEAELKRYQNAFELLKNADQKRDSIFSSQTAQELAELQKKYEVEKKEHEIKILKLEQERSKVILIVSILIGLLLTGISLFFWWLMKREKRINQLLDYQKSELERLNALKDQFFSILSHDLRSPINAFSSFLEIMRHTTNPSPDKIHFYLKTLQTHTDKTRNLLENLLYWSLVQQEKLLTKPETLSLQQLVDEVVSIYQLEAETKSIQIHVSPFAYETIIGDKNQILLILRNILGNAIKFSPREGKIIIQTQEPTTSHLAVQIIDEGSGIDPEKLQELQSNANWSGAHSRSGAGLGLYLCKQFLKQNQANWEIESKPGRTCFTLYFLRPLQT
ncbi:MAG: ATP-binding protein, partial [Bacteroidia bacterium]|nr:ATP-binding protein [Bacteroidia bacterium]